MRIEISWNNSNEMKAIQIIVPGLYFIIIHTLKTLKDLKKKMCHKILWWCSKYSNKNSFWNFEICVTSCTTARYNQVIFIGDKFT
jgi:hypothetical protein